MNDHLSAILHVAALVTEGVLVSARERVVYRRRTFP